MRTPVANIYLIGICGTGVGALAGMLKQLGHQVRGSDAHVYPPMSTKLRQWGIDILEGYDAAHLQPVPDLVVVGNVIRATNPEATWVREHHVNTLSMPQALAEFGIGAKHSVVIAGTHGKTTISALTTHLLMHAGLDPSYLVGGDLLNYPESFHHGTGKFFVVEGDEYDTAYFDKGPKFLHYRARTAVISSLEFDHADIFDSVEAVENCFAKLLRAVPHDGHLVVWHGAHRARRLMHEHCSARRISTYATTPQPDANVHLAHFECTPAGLTFEPVIDGHSLGTLQVPLWGEMAACNALAALCAVEDAGLTVEQLRAGFLSFAGVRRRLEVRAEVGGIAVVDDFAHHPTAVQMTLQACRLRWPGRRLVAIFEPRSATSRRNIFQQAYVEAFAHADAVVIGSHPRLAEVPEESRFNPALLAQQLTERGVAATAIADPAEIGRTWVQQAQNGDVLLLLSNGDFGGLHETIIAGLQQRFAAPHPQR
jgi:UDP-N-acetylmuramate: L-alanyl-gamma-D-glutamyl-meso-diaminopimelate ligase